MCLSDLTDFGRSVCFFPQTTSRGKQAMILKNPADDLGIAIVNIKGRGAKKFVTQTSWLERYQHKTACFSRSTLQAPPFTSQSSVIHMFHQRNYIDWSY